MAGASIPPPRMFARADSVTKAAHPAFATSFTAAAWNASESGETPLHGPAATVNTTCTVPWRGKTRLSEGRMDMARLRMRGHKVHRALCVPAVLGVTLLSAASSHAAQITWYSATTQDGSDEPFISLLQGAGHTVTRFPSVAGDLSDAQIAQL